ncbi:Putative cystathionine beta-lyase [Hyphomicrobiales bacterium]|nr:Putative cystathionine beta-lyase [Hyphomicrobiales bacterium]
MHYETRLLTTGRDPEAYQGVVNTPVFHASTVVFPTVAALQERQKDLTRGVLYGRLGTPTTFAFEEAMTTAEGGFRSVAAPSGMAAIAIALLGLLKTGDHLLCVDTLYDPARYFINDTLIRYGVEVTYYPPEIGAGIAALIKPNTRVVYCESPGSGSFEIQDIPAIAAVAHEAGAMVVLDNTWASPLYFKPFEHGVDVSIQAATKYIVGHSDAELGSLTATEEAYPLVKRQAMRLGICVGPDDCYLGMRGLRTLATRLPRHQDSAMRIARWLQEQPEVEQVLYPALPGAPGHEIWKRDFLGATGLFGVALREGIASESMIAMLDNRKLFKIGFSWGGYESLLMPSDPAHSHPNTPWRYKGPCFRVNVGLEHVDDLLADLEAGFEAMRNHQKQTV